MANSIEILNNIELIRVGRSATGSAFFTPEQKAVLEILEVGQGFVIPPMEGIKMVNQIYNHRKYMKAWAKEAGKQLLIGEVAGGIAVKRVG